MKPKYDVFISYRRNGGYETAKHLYDLLSIDGYKVSFDLDTLRSGDFDTELLSRIDQCTDFILIIDAKAFDRTLEPNFPKSKDWLRCELSYALQKKKNIIPVFLSGISGFPDGLPDDVAEVTRKNGPQYNQYYFDDFYRRLKQDFIQTKSSRHLSQYWMRWIGFTTFAILLLLCLLWGTTKYLNSFDSSIIDETEKDVIEFQDDYNGLKIGDYLYEDGTYSHGFSTHKNAVGVVFSLNTSVQERKNGWDHGLVMALSDCGQGEYYQWGKSEKDLTYPHMGFDFANVSLAFKDKQGYLYTYKGETNSKNFPAFVAARSFLPKLQNGSGWYVPTLGQWADILKNLGGIEINIKEGKGLEYDEETAMNNLKSYNVSSDYYWTSTEVYNSGASWVIYLGQRDVNTGYDDDAVTKTKKCKVRAVAAI